MYGEVEQDGVVGCHLITHDSSDLVPALSGTLPIRSPQPNIRRTFYNEEK